MSVLVERSMGDLNKEGIPVYPLFQKGATIEQPQPKKRNAQPNPKTSDAASLSTNVPKDGPRRRNKKSEIITTTDSMQIPTSRVPSAENGNDLQHGELLEVDPNNGRRKRRKTASVEEDASIEAAEALLQEPTRTKLLEEEHVPAGSNLAVIISEDNIPAVVIHDSRGIIQDAIVETKTDGKKSLEAANRSSEEPPAGKQVPSSIATFTDPEDFKPRKVLRLNTKTGTIGSPPAKKPNPSVVSNGKKTTTSRGKPPKSKVVTIRYGQGQPLPATIGQKIDQILNTAKPAMLPHKLDPPKIVKNSPPKSAKSTHPFFLGKAAAKSQSPQKPKMDPTIIDLTQPKEQTPQARARPSSRGKQSPPSKPPIPFSGFGASAKIVKFLGAVEPAWPCKGTVHVRGSDLDLESSRQLSYNGPNSLSHDKKSKYQAIRILEDESILGILAKELCISNLLECIRDINPDEFPPIPDCLRIPIKHLEPGFDLQRRIRKELHARIPPPSAIERSSSEDEIQQTNNPRPRIHPAILKTYGAISTSLSAFDRGLCDSQAWIHKYSPKLACDVLQTVKEISILKEWLQSLTVKSVEAGLGNQSRASSLARRLGAKSEPNGKRKRKSKKLDGFVVSSDEEADDMDEISEPDDDASPSGSQGLRRKTIVRTGDIAKDSGRLTNAVVISGPHGCGKTAAVYAVAKELGFEVFELNPGTRRSGKDILERVGDMARNHQVQRISGLVQVDGAADEDRRRIDEALANDLKSGRQGTMNSFFKTQPTPKPKAKAKAKPTIPASKPSTKEAQINLEEAKPRLASKPQKQSLILIEEADILYKDDTQFWPTILSLIATSKRPIIITCNDESVLPMASLPLHAVIRMSPPPLELAVDYMLLVAACEGHTIPREAVRTLYESRKMDLRAALTELNFWCQFAIGDQKNGLGWYLPRGNNVDNNGNSLRVVSEGTYATGMGWLSQDILESDMHHLDLEEETLHETCDGWNLDVGDWQKTVDMRSWAQDFRESSGDRTRDRAALRAYEEFTEAISSADLCSGGLFASDSQLMIDATMPELTIKAREDFTLASELLETSILVNHDTLSKDISLWMKSRSRNYLQVDQHVKMDLEVPPELRRPDETDIIRLIRKEATTCDPSLNRRDFSAAFDPISEPEKTSLYNTGQLEASVFDRTMNIIATDMAPYVRSIVDYDARLREERTRRSNLMSEGGRKGKKMRMTRSAMSALEGGARSTTRREKYFTTLLNPYLVMKTGMQSWVDAALVEMSASGSRRSSKGSLDEMKTESEKDELMDGQ
ncbi:hypothetical protein EG329_005806 [Mollisiaceae sp. DMI_Dod_QoI]|nr:hypothetical protein EG329_005806 [Helotiales sp. DMI_Dod_QoI]